MSKKTVYIAGAISLDPNYKEKFKKAQEKIEELGFKVLSPTCIRDDLDYNDYFPICYGMIDVADYMVIIDYSKGVGREINYAEKVLGPHSVYGLKKFIKTFDKEEETFDITMKDRKERMINVIKKSREAIKDLNENIYTLYSDLRDDEIIFEDKEEREYIHRFNDTEGMLFEIEGTLNDLLKYEKMRIENE